MKIKHDHITIEPGNPFGKCRLERKKYADVLTEIINTYSDGFVLAINNKWGTGKTTFIQMWEQDLKDKEYKTVYFNAWENDFENNPLVALMGELKTTTKKETEKEFNGILKKAATLSKHIAPAVAQAVIEKYIDSKELKSLIVKSTEGLANIFENDVNNYAEKKKSISEFRTSLSHFVANANSGKPLVFIIDELDRCRPNYAVSILEQVKHFFSVPNIVFVLSIDKEQLGNAIRGVYGTDKLDADEYLRRFIDIEYSIPEPDKDVFYKHLYSYFEFDNFLGKQTRIQHYELKDDKKYFLDVSDILFSDTSITLRQIEKIYSHSRLSLRSFTDNMYLIPEIFLFLIFLKVLDEKFYKGLKSKSLSIKELQEKYYLIISNRIVDDNERILMWLEAHILWYYINYVYPYHKRNQIYEYDSNLKSNKLLIKSVVNGSKDAEFLSIFDSLKTNSRRASDLDFGHFFKRIDLTESMVN